jgi:hypothetical protein
MFSNRYITGFECNTGSGAGIDVKAEVGLPVMTRVGAVAETSETGGVVVAYCCLAIFAVRFGLNGILSYLEIRTPISQVRRVEKVQSYPFER